MGKSCIAVVVISVIVDLEKKKKSQIKPFLLSVPLKSPFLSCLVIQNLLRLYLFLSSVSYPYIQLLSLLLSLHPNLVLLYTGTLNCVKLLFSFLSCTFLYPINR